MAQVLERDVVPPGHYRMPGPGRDGTTRRRGRVLMRLLHFEDQPVLASAHIAGGAVRVCAEGPTLPAAAYGIDRMRFALALDLDLAPFQRAFRRDPLLGPIIRRQPHLRPRRHAEPFQALAWAVCEQLIEAERAHAIQRRLVWRYGRASDSGSLRDAPSAAALAARAPAELEACDLVGKRARALVRASREVASGRCDLHQQEEPAWRRLRAIPNVGAWTLEKLAWLGQGRCDQLPAGDLAYLKLVGRLAGLDRRATEEEVREYFAPYAPFQALAGYYLLAGRGLISPARARARW